MFEETERRPSNRILYPPGSWFPLQEEVFKSVFPNLREKVSRHLYLAIYERILRHPSKPFKANLTNLSRMIDHDTRTVRTCIVELVGEGFVEMVGKGGALRSRYDKPTFAIPLAEAKLASGHWFPVPRFLITDYLLKYEGSLVLIALLYHQHLQWKPDCWPGVRRLSRVLGMNRRTIYAYLNTMGHEVNWKKLGIGLPWPLTIEYSGGGKTRHFSVRAAQFYTPAGKKKPVVTLRKEFADYLEAGRKNQSRK